MTCCTFVYSVINLIWNKQYVFFIILHPIDVTAVEEDDDGDGDGDNHSPMQ